MPLVTCQKCAAKLKVPVGRSGRIGCPKCRAMVIVPAPTPSVEEVDVEPVFESPTAPPVTVVCPYCAEAIQRHARKCRHCGEILDPVMRATQASQQASAQRVQRRERAAEEDDNEPRRRRGLFSCGGLLFAIGGAIAIIVLFGMITTKRQQIASLDEGAKLWDGGQHDAAVKKYMEGFPAAGGQKPALLQRIVEHLASKGDEVEAMKWIETGLNEKVEAKYDAPDAVVLADRVKRDRAERVAKAEAEKVAKAKQREDEKTVQVKNKAAGQAVQDRQRANRALPREKFRELLTGIVNAQEVINLLGKPDRTQSIEGIGEMWYYSGVAPDPASGKRSEVQIEIDSMGVKGVNFY